ncbi:hypothetical protein G9298_18065 [Bacillus thuringiensis]|uniref:hypothetical protein n=1 Tax=Bacillus cereus TaxID=1396 RepID=UPI0018DAF8FA|nr:hypothetical protein G9298_18065 [Bacillus thuringiensis]
MEIYKVSEVGIYGEEVKPKFYKLLDDAQQEFHKVMKKLQEELSVVKDPEDVMNGEKPVWIKNDKDSIFPSDVLLEGVINYWYKCSHEHDEWDVAFTTVIIEKVEVL